VIAIHRITPAYAGQSRCNALLQASKKLVIGGDATAPRVPSSDGHRNKQAISIKVGL